MHQSWPGAETLVDVPCLINEVEYHPVFDTFIEFVSVDIAAEDFHGSFSVLL